VTITAGFIAMLRLPRNPCGVMFSLPVCKLEVCK